MKVYEATITDKCWNPDWEEPAKFTSYVAVGTKEELKDYEENLPEDFSDEDIHYYFLEGEHDFDAHPTIETDEFIYDIIRQAA